MINFRLMDNAPRTETTLPGSASALANGLKEQQQLNAPLLKD